MKLRICLIAMMMSVLCATRSLGQEGTNVSDYLIVDISGGPSATNYPVSYLTNVPSGGWTDEYKSTKMAFRRIPAGAFTMGSPTNEFGRETNEVPHQVTLTNPFYMGVFEVTQKQWERVMGTWPSYFNNPSYRDYRPVEWVSYNDIRGSVAGANWPSNNNVDASSFMGRLRARTGVLFDLPTESQWEYAGRAGTITSLNSGNNVTNWDGDAQVAVVGRYWYNGGSGFTKTGSTAVATADVGGYQPNDWGLYDIHGNLWEWCLDYYDAAYPGDVVDPRGPLSGAYRSLRGGAWIDGAHYCRSAFRGYNATNYVYYNVGFRAAIPLDTLAPLVWNAAAEFSVTNGNPSGVWSYGWLNSDFTAYTLHTTGGVSTNGNTNPMWCTGDPVLPLYGAIWKNISSNTLYGCAPGQMAIHPGSEYGPCSVRWTAPEDMSGLATVTGRFFSGDAGVMPVSVRVKGVSVWSASDAGQFNFTTQVAPGDTIDFVVTKNSGIWAATTPVEAVISMTSVFPSSGLSSGGTMVTIQGGNLGSGSDITNVTICGVAATIVSQSVSRVVVETGPSAGPFSTGAVRIYSTSCGITIASNAFTYVIAAPEALPASSPTIRGFNANWSAVAGAEHYAIDVSTVSNFSGFVSGYSNLNVGTGTSWPVTGLNAGTVYYYRVRVQSSGAASINSAVISQATLNGGLSLTNGPYSGGNVLTIFGTGLGNGADITNVVVGGVVATIIGQTTNSVTVILGPGAGVGSVVVQSESLGTASLPGAYAYNPAGVISGATQDWSRWEEVAGLPAARDRLAAGVLNGQLYAVGGQNGGADRTNVYRFAGTNWIDAAGLPVARSALALGVLNNALYAIGGSGSTNVFGFNGSSWTEVAGVPEQWQYASAASLSGSLYTLGGSPPGPVNIQTNVYRYDGAVWSETAGAALRGNVAAGVLNGFLYAAGGTSNGLIQHTNVYRYDGVSWSEEPGMPAPREGMGVGALDGSLYVFGGYYSASGSPGTGIPQTNTYRFNGTGWTEVAGLPAPRGLMGSAVYEGALYAIGGMSGGNTSLSTMKTNVYRYPATLVTSGVSPSSGSMGGGSGITISGLNLGNGSDITNVVVCGVAASIVSQSSTQVVVTTGATPVPILNGAVSVYSTSYGLSTRAAAYSYTGTIYQVSASAGPNGSIAPNGTIPLMQGLSTNFTIQAAPGHHIAEVLVDGVPAAFFGPTNMLFNYSVNSISSNHTIRASFNTPPVIGISATPTNGVAPLRVAYDFSLSSDTETNIVRCEVDKEGDGIYETACSGVGRVIVEYGAPGQYAAGVRVIDAYGASSSSVVPVTVVGQAPDAVLEADPVSNAAPLAVTFIATNSAAAPNHQIVVHEWDFDGDGIYDLISRTGVVSHVYREPGVFAATLRITDDQGLQDKASVVVTVTTPVSVPPSVTLQAAPDTGTIPLPVSFTASVSNGQTIVEYQWDFNGDGVVDLKSSSGTATHTYNAVGTYQATVVAVDDAGLSGKGTATITVREASSLRVWIVQPKDGAKVSGAAVSLNANAVPASQAASVQLRYRANAGEWVNIGSPLVPPPADFKTTWCATNLINGTACELQAIATDLNGATVTSEVVSVTVDAAAGKVPGAVTEGDVGGKHTQQATFSTNVTAVVDVYDGTSVTVPVGTVPSNVTVQVELTGANTRTNTGAAYGRANINANRKVSLDGQPELNKPITITIPYQDADNNGLVDGTSTPETTLVAYWFDTTDEQWKKPLACEVDTVANLVRVTTYHLTEFGVYGTLNLLHPASGGKLEGCSSPGTNVTTSAGNLTDGNTASYWLSPTAPATQEFVYAFTDFQGAICSEAVLYNYGQAEGLTNAFSRDFEILVSMDGATFTSITNGVLPMIEGPVAIGMNSVTCRVVKLVISSGYGDQYCLAEFELHGTMTVDPNGNGMADAWEMQYFHSLDRTGAEDYDADALSDLNEFIHASNPTTNDTDGDGITDGWEVQYGFQVTTNDAAVDYDQDGMSNLQEFIAGTDPTNTTSVLRISSPEKIGTWLQHVYWDEETAAWETGHWLRVEAMIFTWNTLSGRVYRMNSTTNLLDSWDVVSPSFTGGAEVSFTNWSTNALQRFYRLEVEKTP